MRRHLFLSALVLGLFGLLQVAYADGPAPGGVTSISTQKSSGGTVPFYGLGFDFTAGYGSGLTGIGHQYEGDFSFYFEPTWNIGARFLTHSRWKNLALAGRFSVTRSVAGTAENDFSGNSNSTGPQGTCSNVQPSQDGGQVAPTSIGYCNPAANDRRADYSDVWLTLKAPKIYTIPKLAVNINPSLRLILPASAQSRYATLVMGVTPSVSFSRNFWRDRLHASYGVGFTKNFHTSTSPKVNPLAPPTAAETGSNPYSGIGGTTGSGTFYNEPARESDTSNTRSFSVSNSLAVGANFTDKWSFDLLYITINSWAYDKSCTQTIDGMTINLCQTGSSVAAGSGATIEGIGRSDAQVLWATLGYQALDWLGLSLAYITWAPMYKPDGSYRQAIISTDYNAFTTVLLSATLSVDKLMAKALRKN